MPLGNGLPELGRAAAVTGRPGLWFLAEGQSGSL